jgi:putative two-component system response regulator
MPNGPILVVDDEPINLSAMRAVLADEFRLVFATHGEAALAAVRKHQPSLILLDIEMPGMDGYEVCRQLKREESTEQIPVIFVTGLGDVGNEAEGFAAGAVDYITKPVSPPIVQARVRTHMSLVSAKTLERSYHDAIGMLGEAGHFNDEDTGVHIWRMAAYSAHLAKVAGWDAAACSLLRLAAPMHDTGKIGIPDSILKKPGKLDADEWVTMRTHTTIGHGILARSQAPVFQLAAEVALRHHEKWDGSGYPGGLVGTDIPESARIVALADVFDALAMKRPYKEAWPIEQVVQTILAGRGQHFEPRLVDLFQAELPQLLDIRAQWDEPANP